MISLLVGFFSGILSGMGVGGGMLLIPGLRMFCDMSQHAAQAVNLFCFIPSSLCALIIHLKNKKIEIKTAMGIILTGAPFSLAGAYICTCLSSKMLSVLFGVFLLCFGVNEIIRGLKSTAG